MIWTSTAHSGNQEGAEERPNRQRTGRQVVPKLVFHGNRRLPAGAFVRYYDQYTERGSKLLLDKGGWYGNNHYSHATTYTALVTRRFVMCAPLQTRSGRERLDRQEDLETSVFDEDARFKYLDEETPDHSGTSLST